MKRITQSVTGFYTAEGNTIIRRYAGAEYCAVVSDATRAHERFADRDSPRTRAATIWRIEHRDDYANTIY